MMHELQPSMIYELNQPRTKSLGASLCSSRWHLLQIFASACPKQSLQGETLRDPTGPRQDAVGSPKHAARTLIRHSDRRTMRTTRQPICIPGEFLKSAMRRKMQLAYTRIRWMMTPAHTQS